MLNPKVKDTANKIETATEANSAIGKPETSQYRLNLTLDSDAKNELEKLKIKTHKSSSVDVLRAALTIYRVIVEHQEEGGRVVFRNSDDTEETLFLV